MAAVNIENQFSIALDSREFRLIGLALSGRLKNKEDLRLASELSVKLMSARAHQLRELQKTADGALERALEVDKELAGESKPD